MFFTRTENTVITDRIMVRIGSKESASPSKRFLFLMGMSSASLQISSAHCNGRKIDLTAVVVVGCVVFSHHENQQFSHQ